MAIIVKGSCIGIKFTRANNEEYCSHSDKSGRYCIHNGKFTYAIVNGAKVDTFNTNAINSVEVVVFNHAGHCTSGNPNFSEIGVFNVREVQLVPGFNYRYRDFENPIRYKDISGYCKDFRPGSSYYTIHKNDVDKILPTQSIAFCYIRDDGKRDVHNGRYLYWQDKDLNRHCILNQSDKPYRIWYSHMIFNGSGNLVPELRYRSNILGFRRIP
ncbi:MAG: hypothetical protein N3I35_14595 [Clostridia bacterium]|nr:hypothetical protein [Clostridia bacterium]